MGESSKSSNRPLPPLFFGKGFVLTFQERAGDCLDPVRARARQSRGYMRARGADYLAYAVLDAIVDNYFPVLEHIGDVDDLEDQVLVDPSEDLVRGIHRARRALLAMRRAVWPLREALSSLVREHIELIDEGTRVFLRDCYDHAVQVIDLIENYREISAGLMDVYLSSVSNRLNEVMRVLTVISTVFIVPTFLVGVYGMNFRYMPETADEVGLPGRLGDHAPEHRLDAALLPQTRLARLAADEAEGREALSRRPVRQAAIGKTGAWGRFEPFEPSVFDGGKFQKFEPSPSASPSASPAPDLARRRARADVLEAGRDLCDVREPGHHGRRLVDAIC